MDHSRSDQRTYSLVYRSAGRSTTDIRCLLQWCILGRVPKPGLRSAHPPPYFQMLNFVLKNGDLGGEPVSRNI
jgi:hypothetical protein